MVAALDDGDALRIALAVNRIDQPVFVGDTTRPESARSPFSGSGFPSPVKGIRRVFSISSFSRACVPASWRHQWR